MFYIGQDEGGEAHRADLIALRARVDPGGACQPESARYAGGRVMVRAVNWRMALPGGETRPQVFECDDGQEWVLKLPGNPHGGLGGLCADWIGTVIASRVGVSVLPCELVEVDQDAVNGMPAGSEPRRWARPGVAFATRYVKAQPVSGMATILSHSTSLDRMLIVATDTWLDVLDRKKPGLGEWNLLVDVGSKPQRMVVIDFGMGLGELLGPPILGSVPMAARIPAEWLLHLDPREVDLVLNDVGAVPRAEIETVVRSLPAEWTTAVPGVRGVPDYLERRRERLAACLRKGLSRNV
jgi:hypothetical protein